MHLKVFRFFLMGIIEFLGQGTHEKIYEFDRNKTKNSSGEEK